MTKAVRIALLLCAGVAFVAPLPAAAQSLGGADDFAFPLVRLVLGLLACTLVALITALALRRFMRGRATSGQNNLRGLFSPAARKIRVIESHRLSPTADVCMFACEDRQYLVVVSSAGATLLREQAAGAPRDGGPVP